MVIIGFIVYNATRIIPYGSDIVTIIGYMFLRMVIGVLISAGLITILLFRTQEFQNAKVWLISHIKLFK